MCVSTNSEARCAASSYLDSSRTPAALAKAEIISPFQPANTLSSRCGRTWWTERQDISFGSARKDVSLFFGLDTFLGPAFLAAGYDFRGRTSFYLFLGRGF